MKKSELLELIAGDEIRPALEIASRCATALQRDDFQEDILLLTSQWENLDREERSGSVSREDLQQNRNAIKKGLITLVSSFPDELNITTVGEKPGKEKKIAGIEEGRFKRQIFFFMLAAKAWIVYWILFHKNTGGFTSGEALATISLLLPAFTAYTTVMLGDIIRHRHRPVILKEFARHVSRTLQTVTWIVFPAYVLALHCIIGEKAAGTLADNAQANYESMTAWLAIVESAFGVYVGQIINEVFKKEGK